MQVQGQVKFRSGQGARMDDSGLTIFQVDLIQVDDYPADSCAISPMAFLFYGTFSGSKYSLYFP